MEDYGRPFAFEQGDRDAWRTFFTIDTRERDALQNAAAESLPGEQFAFVTELLSDGRDGDSELVLSVHATDDNAAIEAAARIYNELRRAASLSPVEPAPLFALIPPPHTEPLDEQLIARAENHLRAGAAEEAIIFAQTAAELYVTGTLRFLVRHLASEVFADALMPRSITMREQEVQRLFNRLSDSVVQKESWWGSYVEHVRLRNAIVHEGAQATVEDASRSLKAVWALRRFVGEATGRALGPPSSESSRSPTPTDPSDSKQVTR